MPSHKNTSLSRNGKKTLARWRKTGFCTNGTIPIRRKTKEDLIKAIPYGSLGYYPNQMGVRVEEEFAGVTSTPPRGRKYNGVSSQVNVWATPNVDFKEYSAAAIGLREGNRNWLRAGIMINFALFGDGLPRLFTSWKNASNHGCFNDICDGFVLTNPDYPLGTEFPDISVFGGEQEYADIKIYRENVVGNWWLMVLDETIGYWPRELLGSNFRSNAIAEWTGIVLNSRAGRVHTKTTMGSGHFPNHKKPEASLGSAAFFAEMNVIKPNLSLKRPDNVNYRISYYLCYSAEMDPSGDDEEEGGTGLLMYYGGPGGSGCDR